MIMKPSTAIDLVAHTNVRYFLDTFGNSPAFKDYLNAPSAAVKLAQLMGINGLEDAMDPAAPDQHKQR